ncbi:uncharacterized protein LOC115219089 [Octopus sinensis]|uniref:Uncharacterized protein LOC115219089 n=1 Tax=Octopus sinensis TaxID=2607531 RepID=A0A6P7T2S7_9MOLL|nr:uncharacterized protein LOC115219089 [Octopus sinensis]XP_036364586.1 uncharacterized protein LOC115219089 [Octopus sinensis]
MEIPEKIADKLVREVDARQLLSELKGLNPMTSEGIECTIERHGRKLGMKELIRELPRFDNWDCNLVKALRSNAINKKAIANEFSQWICKKKGFDCHLIHFERFLCLDKLNAAGRHPNWKDLALKLGLSTEDRNRIENHHMLDENFMHYVMEELADKTLKDLLLALTELGLIEMHDEIKGKVRLRQRPQQQNHQAQSNEPPTTGRYQQPGDHYETPGTAYSCDSYFQENREKEEEKKGVSNKFSSSLTHDSPPIECTSLPSESRHPDPIRDQENKLKECNNARKIENTIEGRSSPEDNTSVEATPLYPPSYNHEQQIEPDSNDYQYGENNLNIDERDSDTSTAEEMPDVASLNNDCVNERIISDNAQENQLDIKKYAIILLGITGIFLVYRYSRH